MCFSQEKKLRCAEHGTACQRHDAEQAPFSIWPRKRNYTSLFRSLIGCEVQDAVNPANLLGRGFLYHPAYGKAPVANKPPFPLENSGGVVTGNALAPRTGGQFVVL
jgi:hypothetical protein